VSRRIWISSDRVTVSKPGVDAQNPPAIDYRYLALDSRLQTGRPLEIGIVPNHTFGTVINFTTTYQAPPAVDVTFFSTGQLFAGLPAFNYSRSIGMRDASSSVAYNRTSYYFAIEPSRFQVTDDAQFVRSAQLTSPQNLFYIAWPTW
jgi:predicted homoserine dehydrogenase-like protein